jgi:Ala-tRNA(Pro) deacylase
MSPFQKITELLDRFGVEYRINEHEDVVTSAEAERVTGHPSTMGAKSILFKVDNRYILGVIKGSEMADFKKLRAHFGSRKARLATPDEVFDVMKVKIGACYPFGDIAGVEMVVDETLAVNKKISFSPGEHDKHIIIGWNDYLRVTKPVLIDIIKL